MLELAAAAVRDGHDCLAVVPGPCWLADALRARQVPIRYAIPGGGRRWTYFGSLLAAIRTHRPEVVHAHFLGPGVYAMLASLLTGTRVVVTFHGFVDLPVNDRFSITKTWLVRRAHALVAVSAPLQAFLAERFRLPLAGVDLVPNGIDTRKFRDAQAKDFRAILGLPPSAQLIGSVGNIREAKDYGTGLRALSALCERGVDAHWLIAGQPDPSGTLLASLRAEADRLGVTDRLHLLGFVSDPERFLKSLDAYLLCSKSEGHPLSMCQAMVSGRPIVATRCGVETFLKDGEDSWVVPVGDAAAIASSLAAALADPQEGAKRGDRARTRALEEYDGEVTYRRYLAIYDRTPG